MKKVVLEIFMALNVCKADIIGEYISHIQYLI